MSIENNKKRLQDAKRSELSVYKSLKNGVKCSEKYVAKWDGIRCKLQCDSLENKVCQNFMAIKQCRTFANSVLL